MAAETWNSRIFRLPFPILCGLIVGLLCINAVRSRSPCDLRRQFSCRNHPSICIPKSQVRDGVTDCPDASDEDCPSSMHQCRCGIPRCIERRLVGDGILHCLDGSDEGEDDSNYMCPESGHTETSDVPGDLSSTDVEGAKDKSRSKRQTAPRRDQVVYPTGIISAFTGTEVNGGTTTLHRTELYRTYLDGSYTEILHSSSSVLPTATDNNRNQDDSQITHLCLANKAESFGSLSSGKVYLTAVSEPVSSLSSSVLPAPHTKKMYESSVSSFLENDEEFNENRKNEFSPLMTVTGSIIPNSGVPITKHLILDVSARTVGTSYPQHSETSVISVTGTEGHFIQRDVSGDKTYSIFTGSYISGSEHPTTYVFFFGNSPLTSEVRVVLPTKTLDTLLQTVHQDSAKRNENRLKESVNLESNNVETKFLGLRPETDIYSDEVFLQLGSVKRVDYDGKNTHLTEVLSRRTRRDEDEVVNRLRNGDTIISDDATPIYDNEQPFNGNVLASHNKKPIAITRYIQPTSSREKSAYILVSTSANDKTKDGTAQARTLRGHPRYNRHGRMYQPTPVAGRRIQGTGSATIITDQFIFPTDIPYTENRDLNDEVFYEDAAIKIRGQDLNEEFRKFGGIGRFIIPSKSSFSDKRVTKTVGLYGPIYDIDYEPNKDETAAYVNTNSTAETTAYHSNDNEENNALGDKTITLFGFAEFSTKISGTNYIFMPASTLPRTFTPRVTRTNFFRETAGPSTKESHQLEADVFFRQPLYGTETREFVSQMSMFTSTVKDPLELRKTMVTVTVATKQMEEKSRIAKLGKDTVLPEIPPTTRPATFMGESQADKDYSINIENLQMSNVFPENSMELDITEIVDDVPQSKDNAPHLQPTGLLSSITGTEVGDGMTTHWTTLIFGTYVDDTYAHIIQSTSSIFYTITKTATPEGISYETSEVGDNLYDTVKKSEFPSVHGSFYDTSMDKLSPSLNDISSSFSMVSFEPTDELSATSAIQILTSGFFLPNENNLHDVTESLTATENLWNSENSEDEKLQKSADQNQRQTESDLISPSMPYESHSYHQNAVETPKNSDPKLSTPSLQILTEGFILPTFYKNPLQSSLANMNVSTTHVNFRTTSNGNDSSDANSLHTEKKNVEISLEDYINSRNGLAAENRNEIDNDSHVASENSVSNVPSNTLFSNSGTILYSNSTSIIEFDLASEQLKEKMSTTSNLEDTSYTSKSHNTSIHPIVAYDADSSIRSSLPSIVLLTGDFILPRQPVKENKNQKDEETNVSNEHLHPSILTDGFILPEGQEKDSKGSSESRNVTSSKISANISSTAPLSILTAGFILPGKKEKSENSEAQNNLPSSELLTADFLLSTKEHVPLKDQDSSVAEARSAGSASNQIITDRFILPTPVNIQFESNIEDGVNKSENGNSNQKNNRDSIDALLNLAAEKRTESSTPRSGKALKLSHETHSDATRVEELLPSISYPITYYTTSTYFTTFLLEGSTVVSSREETISQVYSDSDHLHQEQRKSANSEDKQEMTHVIRPSKSQDFYPDYTTITYYKTLLQNGSVVVTSTEETKSRTVHAAQTPSLPSQTSYPVSTYPTTYYTTLTYFTTLLRDGSTDIITSKTVMSNVVPSSDDVRKIASTFYPAKHTEDSTKIDSKPTTYYTTYTYYTTFLRDGETSVNTRLHTVSNVVYGNHPATSSSQIAIPLQQTSSTSLQENVIKPTTYFTTYTYYTTYLRNDKTVVSSREEVVSNVLGAETVSPSRTESAAIYSTKPSNPVKTTFYTTYTYYTTFLRDGTTTVTAREETVTNIKYDHPTISSDVKSTRTEHMSHVITPTPAVKTYYTTYTYFTTFLRNGSTVVSSRESTVENVVIQTEHSSELPSPSSISPTRIFSTYYTTLTSYFTLFKEGSPSVSTVFSTLTDVVALSTPDIRRSTEHLRTTARLSPVTTTYTTVFTYYTTHFSNGAPIISSREETRSNVVILPTAKTTTDRGTTIVHAVTPLTSLHKGDSVATLFPTNVVKTYYTTFSYFTTFLKDGLSSVSTRLETVKSYETSGPDLELKLSKPLSKLHATTSESSGPGLFGSPNAVPSSLPSTFFSPVTHYTTYTYYTTLMKGGSPIVNSRTEVLSSVVSHAIDNKQTLKHVLSTELLQDENPVSISKPHADIKTTVANPSHDPFLSETRIKTDLDAAEGEFLEKRVQPTAVVTYFSTHTYLTTSIEANGHTQLLTRKVTASATVTPETGGSNEKADFSIPQQPRSAPILSSSLIECCNENSKTQHKHTVYTTYTFHTTSYNGTTPVVTSRFEKITNVIDEMPMKTLLEINPSKTIVAENFISSESQNSSSIIYSSSSVGNTPSSGQGPHIKLIEESYNLRSVSFPNELQTTLNTENRNSLNSSQNSEEILSPEPTINKTKQNGEEKENKIPDNSYSEAPIQLNNANISSGRHQVNETSTASFKESLLLETDETTVMTTVDSLPSTESTRNENSENILDSSELTAIPEKGGNLTNSISLNETTTNNSVSEETAKTTTEDTKALPEETLTTTTEAPRRGIFSRRNRPSYRPRPTTRLTSPSPTTLSTTASPRTSAPFGKRNTSRHLFRRTNPTNRTFPLRRLRISKPLAKVNDSNTETQKETAVRRKKRSSFISRDKDYQALPNLRKLLNARDEDAAIKNNDLVYPYSKHDHGGIVIRSAYEENSSPREYRISPMQNSNDLYPTGLIRSLEAKAVNNGITTVYATEIHGTYINGAYAQVVHSSTKILSDTSNEIDRTSLVMPSIPVQISLSTKEHSPTVNHQKVGLVSSHINTSIRDGKTTLYTTNIYGTYVGEVYAHIAQTFSSVVSPTSTVPSQYSTGLISSSLRSEIHDGSTTMWTTHIYGTFVNGYYAHIASTLSNVYGPQTKKPAQPTLLPSGFNNHIYAHATPDADFMGSEQQSNSANVQHQPRRIDQDKVHPKQENKVGLLSSFVSNFVRDGTTTEYITNIYGTFVGQQYAQHMQTTSRIIIPKQTESPTRSVGLLSTMLNSVINENTATIYKTEIYGTYIGQHYAQIARTSTETRVIPLKTTKPVTPSAPIQRTGLITTSIIRSEVVRGTTTLHLNEIYGTYIGNAYAHVAKSTSRIIQNTVETQNIPSSPSQNPSNTTSQKTGLVSSKVSTEVNDGTTTLHISEIHGTYIGSYYAHIARRTSTVLPFITPSSTATLTTSQMEGIISSIISTEVNYGTTTLHTREIYGTTINGFYAHIARSTSNVITPSSVQSKTAVAGLVSVITNSEVNGGLITLYTTEIFGTTINGFYAHVARSSSAIIPATSSEQPLKTNGLISVTNSTEISNGISTIHETSLIGSEVNGRYVQAVKSTSHVIYGSKPFEEHSTKASVQEVDVRQTLPVSGDRDFLDTARVNQVDSDNHHEHFSSSKQRNLATPASLPSYYDILSPSFNSDNVLDVESSQTATPNIPLQLRTQSDSSYKELVSTLSYLPFLTESLTIHETIGKSLRDKISSFQVSSSSEELTEDNNTTPMEDENEDDYNDYCEDEKSCKFKETRTTKPNRSDQEEKRRASTRPPPKKLRSENDYDDYDFDQDYEEYEKKKEIGKHISSVTPSRDRSSRTTSVRNSQQDIRKTTKTSFPDRDYDDYEDDYDDEQSSYQTSTESTESQSTKEQQTNSVRIRPFASRGRPTFTTPIRTTTKPSFTIQFRRPSRVRNSRAFGQRSDSENNHDFDEDLENEEEEGDIEASEAVVTSATPQVLPFRRKTFGSQRFQPLTRSSSTSTTTTTPRPPLILNRNRRLFGRSFSTSPSPTTSLKDNVSDYVENTTEDDDFDNYDDIEEKDEGNGNQRGLRLTRRPSSRFSRTYGERRSPSIKRGTVRQREDEEVENDDIDSTTPDYRSSRNNRYQRKQNRGRLNQNRSPSLKTSFNSVNRDEDEDPHSLQPINRLRNNRRRQHSYNPRTRRPTKTATETQTSVKKPHLTVTSVVTTVKTLPIYHGFRTSYATLTTTALDTSIINPSQYSTVVNDGLTKTLVFSKVGLPDGLENFYTTITEVVITTTSLASVKLVPIKIGFSTRTDTVTDIQVLTTLSTVYSTISPDTPTPTAFPQQFQPPPFFPQIAPQNQDFGLFNSPSSFVTTQLVTSTTVIPVVLRGRTILSTVTTTSTAESTVVQTANIRVPQVPSAAPFIPQPYFAFQPITTQITLYVTGEYGELKPVVTTVTVPLYQQPVFHTKVARSLQSAPTEQPIISTELPKLVLKTSMNAPRYLEIDTHYDKLLSSGLEEINDISEILNSRAKTDPLESTALTPDSDNYNSPDVTTILKGPLTEIYEQKATVNIDLHSIHNEIEHPASRASEKFGIESSYNFRKLQQFLEDDEGDLQFQHEFTRLRRPPSEITRSSAVNNIQAESRTPETLFSRRQPQFNLPRRQPSVEVFTERTTGEGEPTTREQPRDKARESPIITRRLQRPPGNYRPFVRRPSSLVRDETDVRNLPSIEAQPAQPGLNDLDQINGLVDSSRVPTRELGLSNSFRGSPSVEEASSNGFRPIVSPSLSTNVNADGSPTNIQVRPVRLRVVRPSYDSISSKNTVVKRITKTRTINPTHTRSFAVAENELESTENLNAHENSTSTYHKSQDGRISPTLTEDVSLSSASVLENTATEDSYKGESSVTSKEDDNDYSAYRRTVVRRLRPSFVPGDGRGARRPVVVRRTRFSTLEISESNSDLETAAISDSPTLSEVSETIPLSSNAPDLFENENENEYLDTTSPSVDTKSLRKVIRLRRPENSAPGQNYQRRRIVVTKRPSEKIESSTGKFGGPLLISNGLDDRHKYNYLTEDDLSSGKKIHGSEDSDNVPSTNLKDATNQPYEIYSTKSFPFTYYTTLTYFTTFIRGTDVVYASREAVFSNIIHQTLNPSLISMIRNSNEHFSNSDQDQTVHLASRILGDTTTLVNLASKQSVYNSDVYKILKGNDQLKITTTSRPGEHPAGSAFSSVNLLTTNIGAIASLPKTYVTLFTYFYTFYDGNDRRHSTRAETVTNIVADPTQFLSESIGTFINEFGYLPVGQSTNVVHLGSRNVEGTTTEVNLGLKTLVHFSGLRNIILESDKFSAYITPSRTTALPKTESSVGEGSLLPSFETSRQRILTSSLLQPSYVSANELFNSDATFDGVSATPVIPHILDASDNNEVEKSREPFLRVTSVIHKPSGSLRSGVFTPRPGIRIRVKPVVARRPESNTLSDYLSSDYTDSMAAPVSEIVASDTKKLDFYNTILPIPVPDTSYITSSTDTDDISNLQAAGKENELSSEEEVVGDDDQASSHLGGPTRKRLKITVRRPQSGSVSRTHTRFVLPSRFEITSKPRFYVVTRTGAVGVVSPSQRPFTVKISRKVKSSAAEDGDMAGSTTVLYDTYTTLTTVPVIFGLETSFRNVLLTTSSPVTVTQVSPSYEEETQGIQPSHTVVLTYFTTTTFTIPYTIGEQTLFTTLEETNSRIVTTAFDGLDSLTYSTITRTTEATDDLPVKSTHAAITSIEFGFGGPTTHILSSDPDGTNTMSVIYPPGKEGDRATKVIVTNPDGMELTSLYGDISHEKDEMSMITIGTVEDVSSDSSQSTPEPISSSDESTVVVYDTQTFFTTYTVFTTFFTGTDSFVSSYEQVVSNVITVPVTRSIIPTSSPHLVPELSSVPSLITVFDTSEYVTTTTSYKTVTFYATLFNDTMSFVTPIEEVQTETGVITETYTITKTIVPTPVQDSTIFFVTPSPETESSVVVTQTLYTTYTNYVTLFQGTDTVVSNLEEVVSNVVTLTVPASDASTLTLTSETPLPTKSEIPEVISTSYFPIYTTREVLSTQTHYLTIFNGDQKILSSLEEVITSLVTEIASPPIPSDTPDLFLNVSSDSTGIVSTELFTPFTTPTFAFEPTSIITTEEEVEETETYQPELVPSIRTIYSTLTFYTTYFSDTSSIVATQEEVLTSYVTLFVPPSLITSTSTEDPTPTSTSETSSSTSTEQVFIFTTTDYSTLTLYTTLFSGDETTVISSEQVIPEIITATITPSSSSTLPSTPTAESVLTFLTTFTYYTTYFSGADAVIASSESVVTQFVTIEAAPSFTSTASSTDFSTFSVPDETILGVSVVSGGDISSSIKDDIREETIIGVVTAVSSSVATESEQPVFTETSVVSVVSSATRVEVEDETRSDLDISSTVVEETISETSVASEIEETISESSVASEERDLSDSIAGRSHEGRGVDTYDTVRGSLLLSPTLSGDSSVILYTDVSPSKTPDLPITSSSVVTETTEIIGADGKITTLVPSATLMLVTGTDGFVTKLSETEFSVSSLSSSLDTANSTQSSSEIKPATVIELTDLLGGNTAFGGDIGLAIQDIVSLITGKKNKTEGEIALSETTTQDSTTADSDVPKKNDTDTLDSTTDTTGVTESSTPTSAEKDTTKEEVPDLGVKEVDYPIFVPDTSELYTPSIRTDIPTPVYIPSPTIESSSELEINSTGASFTESNVKTPSVSTSTSNDITHGTMTSVITGIRTVFLQNITTSSSSVEQELSISTFRPDSIDVLKLDTVSNETKSRTLSATPSVDRELAHSATPKLSTRVGTSIVTGVKTIFFDTVSSVPDEKTETVTFSNVVEATVESVLQSVRKLQSGSKSLLTTHTLPRGRANDEPSVLRAFTTVTKDGQTIVSRTTSGATTIFYPANLPKASFSTLSTRFITSVESITRTLALTTTRTYYTRDSTLTVPSVYTTTIPPRTFVSTLIGTRTILGILPEPTETIQVHQTSAPTERTTTVTTTTLIFNSIPSTVVRTLVLPTRTVSASTSSFGESTSEESVFSAGTEKPAKPPEVADSTSAVRSGGNRNESSKFKTPFQKARDETYLRAAGPRLRDYHFDVRAENEIARPPIVITEANTPEYTFTGGDIGVCEPSCQPHKKEICRETNGGHWTCQCRPGHARKETYDVCSEVQTYVVLLKVLKMGNTTLNFNNSLADASSEKFREFTKAAKEGISEMYQYTSIRDHYLGSDVNEIIPADKDASEKVSPGDIRLPGVIVNFTVQVSPSVSKNLLEQELTRSLQLADQRVGTSLLTMAPLSQSVRDFDECQDLGYNDCSPNSRCDNTPGSYTCECLEGFEDMDSKLPGRTCLAKTENCDYCHGRGDCLEKEEGKIFCRCLPMFIGRRCEINGLVLAIALPTAVAVVVMLLCGVAFCCRRCRRKSAKTDSSGMFREIALRGPVGSTLDRKAMIDTSSESSGEHGIRNPQAFDGYQESGDVTPKKGSKKSDLSLDRSLSTGYTVPPVMIPRARQHQPHNKMNYAVYNGQVYVW